MGYGLWVTGGTPDGIRHNYQEGQADRRETQRQPNGDVQDANEMRMKINAK